MGEVEEQQISLGGLDSEVTIKLYQQEEDDSFEEWMQTIHARCIYNGKEIGRAFGRYVARSMIRSNFWDRMEEPCQELSNVAFEVFDRYGRLKTEFRDHTIRKGNGCWGAELDLGSLFIIEHVHIEKAWRRKGLGRIVTTQLINKARAGGRNPKHTIVIPGFFNREVDEEAYGKSDRERQDIRNRAADAANTFYRSLGFRRIGASFCFALATDLQHKAHTVPQIADFDPPVEGAEPDVPDTEDVFGPAFEDVPGYRSKASHHLKLLQEQFPLHHAAITLSDTDCLKFYKESKRLETFKEDWAKVDRTRKNILHFTASNLKAESVKWLLQNADEGQVLSSARDIKGYTPLEELESHLESKRTAEELGSMTICRSDMFVGFPKSAIECIAALRGDEISSRIQFERLKFGCTCGCCVDGFLSPRMKFALLCQAEMGHDSLEVDIDNGEDWTLMAEHMYQHVHPDIQRNFVTNKSLRQGFANVFDHAAITLRANKAPTIVNILDVYRNSAEWPPVTTSFYERGGTPESALRTIFESARDQDEWAGDGNHMDVFEEDIISLPECRNDHEFGFVALACGVPRL